jgi:hypothetical protein
MTERGYPHSGQGHQLPGISQGAIAPPIAPRLYERAGIPVTIPAYAFHTSVSESLVERRALAWKSQQHKATLFEEVYIDETSQTGAGRKCSRLG